MGRVLAVVGAALVLCIGGLALAVYLSADESNVAIDNLLSENFTRAVGLAEDPAEGGDGTVDLREYTRDFGWDELVIVAPRTPDDAITQELGFAWKGVTGFETGPLLLFLLDGRLVRFADYRGNGAFAGIRTPFQRLPRERAVFRVESLRITVAR